MVSVSPALGWGVLCGTGLGVGLWSLVSLLPRLSRPRLADRLAPYLLDLSAEARMLVGRRSVDPLPVLGTLFAPVLGWLTSLLGRVLGGADTIEKRLRQSGVSTTVEEFRFRQLVWTIGAFCLGLSITVTVPALRALPVGAQVVVPLLAALGGVVGRDVGLNRAAQARLRRMTSELPTILEFLTLSLSAGEGILDALRRVSASSSGELSRELAGVVTDVHSGLPLNVALSNLSRRLDLPEVTRFVDQVNGALDRGSPLSEVLRAQAQDAREQAKRALLETAGQKEVAMLIPLVFLILPMTIVYAIFPGLVVLQAGF
ncbi:MAG: type II secretion system F family protein [Cryobacterium sp.]